MNTIKQARKFRDYWDTFTGASTNRKIFGAAAIVAAFTAVVKLAAVVKELVVAWRFGTADTLDAFFIALLIPSFVVTVVARSFNSAFIPVYIRSRQQQEDEDQSRRLFAGASVFIVTLLGAMMLLIAAAPLYLPFLASGFSDEKLKLTEQLLYVMSPVILMKGLIALWVAVLNAEERFALAALSPVITPVVTIIFLVVGQTIGVFALAEGVVCGAALEMLLVGAALKRKGLRLLPRWRGADPMLRQVIRQYVLVLAGVLLLSTAELVDQSMAAVLEPGSVSSLNYGKRIIGVLINLTAVALGTAAVPYFSRLIASEDWADLRQTLKRSLSMVFLLTVPLTIVFFLFSTTITRVLFQRGSFTADDTRLVAQIQGFYSLQIPFHVAGILMVRVLSTLQQNYLLMWTYGASLAVNVTLNYILMKWLGVAGIALSTTCVYFLLFLFIAFLLNRELDKFSELTRTKAAENP